jgi:hypothetical protein
VIFSCTYCCKTLLFSCPNHSFLAHICVIKCSFRAHICVNLCHFGHIFVSKVVPKNPEICAYLCHFSCKEISDLCKEMSRFTKKCQQIMKKYRNLIEICVNLIEKLGVWPMFLHEKQMFYR